MKRLLPIALLSIATPSMAQLPGVTPPAAAPAPVAIVDLNELQRTRPDLAAALRAYVAAPAAPAAALAPPAPSVVTQSTPAVAAPQGNIWGTVAEFNPVVPVSKFVQGLDGRPGTLKGFFHDPAVQTFLGANLKLVSRLNQGVADAVGLEPVPFTDNDPMLDPKLYACLTTPRDPVCAPYMQYMRDNLLIKQPVRK